MSANFMAGLQQGANDDANSIARAIVEAITELRKSIDAFTVTTAAGLFTMPAAATYIVLDPNVVAGSVITLQAVNAAAATLQSGAAALYVDRAVTVAGTSFSVKTADASAAVGTEQFSYTVCNPIS